MNKKLNEIYIGLTVTEAWKGRQTFCLTAKTSFVRKVILIRIVYSLYSQKCSIYRPCLSGPAGSGVAASLTSLGCPAVPGPGLFPVLSGNTVLSLVNTLHTRLSLAHTH